MTVIPPTILVIDDNSKIYESLCLAFPEYNFIGTSSGEEGLKCLRRANEIDLVILDYKMNGLDGIQVLREIRRMDAKMGVMIMTSFGTKEVVVEALRGDAAFQEFRIGELPERANLHVESPGRSRRDVEIAFVGHRTHLDERGARPDHAEPPGGSV